MAIPGNGLHGRWRGALRSGGTMTVGVGDRSMGFFIEVGDPSDSDSRDDVLDVGSADLAWVADEHGPFRLARERMRVSPRDGWCFVGVVPDDGAHDARRIFSIADGRDVVGGRSRLNADVSVPSRMLAVFCDAKGDAVFADGFCAEGALRGTDYQRDAEESADGRGGNRYYRYRDLRGGYEGRDVRLISKERPELGIGGAQGRSSLANVLVWICFAVSAAAFFGMTSSMAGATVFLRAWAPAAAVALAALGLVARLDLGRRLDALAADPMVGERFRASAGIVKARALKKGAVMLAVAAAVCAVVSPAGMADWASGPQTVSVTYEGPEPEELLEQYERAQDDDDESDPRADFKDAGGRTYSFAVGKEQITKLADGGVGNEFAISVYPRTGLVDRLLA